MKSILAAIAITLTATAAQADHYNHGHHGHKGRPAIQETCYYQHGRTVCYRERVRVPAPVYYPAPVYHPAPVHRPRPHIDSRDAVTLLFGVIIADAIINNR